LGGHRRTRDHGCWWRRTAAVADELDRHVEGTVEADALDPTAGRKGQAPHGGQTSVGRRPRQRRKKREPGRGHADQDRPAMIAWVRRRGAVVLQGVRALTVTTVQQAVDLAVHAGRRL